MSDIPSVAVIGMGCVGGSVFRFFNEASSDKRIIVGYDKYKSGYNTDDDFENVLTKDIAFLCLPTLYEDSLKQYDKSAINEICQRLDDNFYKGVVVLKSTVEPGTTQALSEKHPSLTFMHNPEFLSARTCFQDFATQSHVVLGRTEGCQDKKFARVENLFRHYWPNAKYSMCTSIESESMKIFCNSFYAMKIGIFNEFNQLCEKTGQDFKFIMSMMLKNGWINEMHTQVPGTDGKPGYGGACFPKDTKALLQHMKRIGTDHMILEGCDKENDAWRKTQSGKIDYY